MSNKSNIELVIAGPGGGKTHNMVGKILNCIETLSPTRYCAVITYTNAATENIRSRIENKITIPQNIFIGTTHSFLIKFIFEPFAHLFDITSIEKNYIESARLSFKPKNQFIKRNCEINAANDLLLKGVITYDKILEQSFELLKNESVINLVSNKLQYIFIDEYQDLRVYQHEIVQKIVEKGKSKLYCIGDPLQSIFRFAYTQSQLKKEPIPTTFKETPILALYEKTKEQTVLIKQNYRSSPQIVSLINIFVKNFSPEFQQEPTGINAKISAPIYFIQETSLERILQEYNALKSIFEISYEDNIIQNLFLSDEWNLFEEIAKDKQIERLIKDNYKASSFLGDVMQLTTGIIGLKKTEIVAITETELEYRKFCLEVLKMLRNKTFNDEAHCENSIRKMFQDKFHIVLNKDTRGKIQIEKAKDDLKAINAPNERKDYYSTIHSSKGLEATSVLICAKTENQLIKWITAEKILSDDDDYRLGYVAFSRARKFLSIACLEGIKPYTMTKLKSLGIELSNGKTEKKEHLPKDYQLEFEFH